MAVPALGAEEPAALDVRRRVPAGAQRARTRDDPCAMRDAGACSRATRGATSTSRVRFLHVVRRQVRDGGRPVDELDVGGERHLAWDEAVEREVAVGRRELPVAIDVAAGARARGARGRRAIVRSWQRSTARRRRRRAGRPGLRRVTVGSPTRRRGTAASARRRCGTRSARRTPCCARAAARSSRSPTAGALRAAAGRAQRGHLAGAGRRAGRPRRCSPRRSSSRTTRGSRPRAPATCSTAARSTRCWRSTSSR